VNSADDFLSSLSPSLKTRVSARLGALRDLDDALEKALADDEEKDRGESNEDGVLKTGAKKKKSAVATLGAFRAEEINRALVSSAEHARSSGYESVEEEGEKQHESVSTTKSGFSRRTPEASLGTSLWDAARTFFGLQTASEAPVDVGSCLCACPGAGAGGGGGAGVDACYDVDLSVAADADGPAACARLAQGANADVCGATGVVQRCEAPGASERGAVGATSSSRSKKKKHSSSSKRARAHAHASKETAKAGQPLGRAARARGGERAAAAFRRPRFGPERRRVRVRQDGAVPVVRRGIRRILPRLFVPGRGVRVRRGFLRAVRLGVGGGLPGADRPRRHGAGRVEVSKLGRDFGRRGVWGHAAFGGGARRG
jgi:hypothetical protein